MSLHYIVDGYNVIRHASFKGESRTPQVGKRPVESGTRSCFSPAMALMRCIRSKRLCGSLKNKVTLVFDGYPTMSNPFVSSGDVELLFSRDESADDRIRYIVEHIENPKIVIVVTDDRSVQFHAKAAGASILGVEEFITAKEESALRKRERDDRKPEISSVDADKINREFRKLWLKES